MDKISLGFISRGRPNHIIEAVRSAWENASHPEHLKIQVTFDEDYKSAYQLVSYLTANDHIKASLGVLPTRSYYVRAANFCLDGLNHETIVFSNDDVSFSRGWDAAARSALASVGGDAIIELGGLPFKCAHFITTRSYLNRVNEGYLAHPSYTFYYSDSELMKRALADGTYRWLSPGVMAHHIVRDDVRAEVNFWGGSDKIMWEKRREMLGFSQDLGVSASDVEIPMTLVPHQPKDEDVLSSPVSKSSRFLDPFDSQAPPTS